MPEHRLSRCGAWAQLLRGMWDLPGSGMEPVSPALAGKFLSTVPPGKLQQFFLMVMDPVGQQLGWGMMERDYFCSTISVFSSEKTSWAG